MFNKTLNIAIELRVLFSEVVPKTARSCHPFAQIIEQWGCAPAQTPSGIRICGKS